jgi:predicted nucleic acid-binding protein
MYYVDTNAVLDYAFETRERHERAKELIDETGGDRYISSFVVLELYCVISRNIEDFSYPFDFEKATAPEIKVKTIVKYAIRKLSPIIFPDKVEIKEIEELNIKVFNKYFEGIRLTPEIKMPSRDTLHVAYANELKKDGKIKYILTFDSDFIKKKDLIERITGIQIINSKN